MKKALLFFFILFCKIASAENDSLLQALINKRAAESPDQGISLIKKGDYKSANAFYSGSINEDQSNSKAYFNRAVTSWAMSDTLSACRDWSAVLAMGDTEMFNLLDSKCHGTMIISNDTIPAKKYHAMFSKAGASTIHAATVTEKMPEFPGGTEALLAYLRTNMKKPSGLKHGNVFVNFLVSPKGKIVYPYIKHGIGGEYDKEALRLVRGMPDWKPGRENNKPVYVTMSLPVKF